MGTLHQIADQRMIRACAEAKLILDDRNEVFVAPLFPQTPWAVEFDKNLRAEYSAVRHKSPHLFKPRGK